MLVLDKKTMKLIVFFTKNYSQTFSYTELRKLNGMNNYKLCRVIKKLEQYKVIKKWNDGKYTLIGSNIWDRNIILGNILKCFIDE